MTNEQLIQLLTDYNSYRYAVRNVSSFDTGLTLYQADRLRMHPDNWDGTRYSRIVTMVEGAINELLSDNQRMVISRMYLERNKATQKEIADATNRDRGTVSQWHKEALRRLRVALAPLTDNDREITNLDHMFKTPA